MTDVEMMARMAFMTISWAYGVALVPRHNVLAWLCAPDRPSLD